jgi:enamine deaminase RidA (YjgF/YER057c/UK114 family)
MVQRVSTGSPFEATFGYSRAVRHEDTVYVSGTTGYDYSVMKMPESVGDQARNALATIDKALKEAGSSIQDEEGMKVEIEVTARIGAATSHA